MKSIKKKNHHIKVYVALVIIVIAIGVGLFFWLQKSTPGSDKVPKNNAPTQTQDAAKTDPNEESQDKGIDQAEGTDDIPAQYEGQTEDNPNANCIDAECSNFMIPENE